MARRSNRRGRGSRSTRPRGEGVTSLPALSSLQDLPTLGELHASSSQLRAFDEAARDAVCELGEGASPAIGCVVRLDRGYPAVATERGLVRAEFAASLTKGEFSRVAVGDWVCVLAPQGHDMAIIRQILPRESDIARWRGSSRGERQTLAANVDTVLVAQALGASGVDVDRIARSAVIALDCGASVAVVLTKADRAGAGGLADSIASVRAVLGDQVPVVACCAGADGADGDLSPAACGAGAGWGTEGVRALVPPGTVAIVLGESGAGKSTLLNALLGHEVLQTGSVRASDDAGRHTTVARRMVSLPGAGVIVDEPGLRSLPLIGHERGLAKLFPRVAQAARECRFRDCTHTHEPGCAVRALAASGEVPPERVDTYVSLASEMRASAAELDPDVTL